MAKQDIKQQVEKLEEMIQRLDEQGSELPLSEAMDSYKKGLDIAEGVIQTLNKDENELEILDAKKEALLEQCQSKAES